MPLHSCNILVNKNNCEDEPDTRLQTKQERGTVGPKGILKNTGFKRSPKTKLVSKTAVYASACAHSWAYYTLRFPEWPVVVYPHDHSKKDTCEVLILFISVSSTEDSAWYMVGA